MTEYAIRTLGGQKAQNPSDVANSKGAVIGLMGLPHSGKTSLVDTLLDDEENCYPVAVFNNDGGAHVVRDQPGKLQVFTPKDYPHMEQMINEVVADPAPFKSVWVDAITYLVEENLDIHDARDASTQREKQISWGDSNFDIVRLHRKLITDLAKNKGVNVFLIYHATRPQIREKSGETVQVESQHIALSNTLALKVEGLLDVLLFIEKSEGNAPYPPRMRLHGSLRYETRLRLAPDNPLKGWPMTVTNPSLSKVVRSFKGEPYTP